MNAKRPTIAILQLSRLGDLLQTIQSLNHIKEENRDYNIVLIGRSQFIEPLEFILKNYFDALYKLNLKEIASEAKSLNDLMVSCSKFISNINNSENIKVLINLTFSKSSTYLASLIESQHYLGPIRNKNTTLKVNNEWSQFIYSIVMRGPLSPFSLVDIYKNIIGTKSIINKLHNNTPPPNNNNQIIIHPFASQQKKSWSIIKWSTIINALNERLPKLNIIICGDKSDLKSAEKLFSNLSTVTKKKVRSVVGRISIEELFIIIQKSDLIVAHDSMVGHLASLSDTKILTIALGTVRPIETTPYQNLSYNISPQIDCFPCFPQEFCKDFSCHHKISSNLVVESIYQVLTKNHINPMELEKTLTPLDLTSVEISQTIITSNNDLKLNILYKDKSSLISIFRSLYRTMWSFILFDKDEELNIPTLSSENHNKLGNYQKGLEKLIKLIEFGQFYTNQIMDNLAKNNLGKVNIELTNKIAQVESTLLEFKKTFPYFYPIIDYLIVRNTASEGDSIIQIAQSQFDQYTRAYYECKILEDLIDKILKKHKTNKPQFNQQKKGDISV